LKQVKPSRNAQSKLSFCNKLGHAEPIEPSNNQAEPGTLFEAVSRIKKVKTIKLD
jgi:hypothetical protein